MAERRAGNGLFNRAGTWYFRRWVKGRLYRLSTGYPVDTKATKEAALRRATELELEVRAGLHGWKKTVPTVAEYWRKTYRPTYTIKKRAPKRDDVTMAKFLPTHGDTPLDQVKKSDCEAFLNALRASFCLNPGRKTPKVVSEGTVQRDRRFLHAFFQQAVEDQYLDRNPWRGVEARRDDVRERLVTEDQQAELLARLSPRFQRFVLFLLGTGLRLDECRGIDIATDLNLPERLVTVTGKFGKTRTVPLPAELIPLVEAQIAEDGGLWRQNPQRLREVLSEACAPRAAVPTRLSKDGTRVIEGRPGRAAIPHLSPHAFRHTFGWRWLKGGGDIYALSKVLGHASVAVTERHYAALLKDDLRAKADRIDLGLQLPLPAAKVLSWAN